jgi:flagellar biosynthesis/type III secretory pathway protein FliH
MATIIKNRIQAEPTRKTVRPVAYNFNDMTGQADDYLEMVRQEAGKIIQQAKQEAVGIKEQAEQAGRKAARDAVEAILDEKVSRQMQSLIPALNHAVSQIEDSKEEWLRHWETTVVKLATAIAKRIIRREIKAEPKLTLEWIREALRLAAGSAEITVRLCPEDHQTLRTEADALASLFLPLANANIIADPDITQGGCRLETEFGVIDQQIETQLARVEEELA